MALRRGDSVIVDRCNFDAQQRQHWTSLAESIQSELQLQQDDLFLYPPSSPQQSSDNEKQNNIDSERERPGRLIKRIITICLVLPNCQDVNFCANRAFNRGNDGVHEPDTDWAVVCRRMKKDFSMPSTVQESFAAVQICNNQYDIQHAINLLSSAAVGDG